ncbi:MAG: long-chain fatty acid--CoA ligase [Verrucomicrobiota bacterium]
MNLARAFAESANKNPTKPALYWGEEEFTYHDLWTQSLAVCERLQNEFGIKPGMRAAIWLKNCPQFIPALFGVLETGAAVVPINNFLKPDEVNFILTDAEVDLVITDLSMAEGAAKLAALRPGLRFLHVEDFPRHPTGPAQDTSCEMSESDLAIIIYTSGTTGRPKGAMLSHGNLLHNVESCRRVLETVGEDRIVVLLPMFHSFMLSVGILLPMLIGGTIVLIKSVHPLKNIVQEIIHRHATILPAVPQLFRTLMHPSIPTDLPLRICVSGGAPLPGEILKEFSARFPMPLIEGYGLSEASPVVTFNPIRKQKAGSIGVPIYDVEVTVQNDAGEILGIRQTGEICVRGGNVMQGYWNQIEETARTMRGEWLLTGDIGHQDEEGYFYITDRKKDMLLVNGINVYPREIEEIIYQFPGVKEAAVVGVPDSRRGEQALAFVSAQEGIVLDEKAIQHFIRDKLADYKVPKRVVILPSLPRNPTGKILKTALRELAQRTDATPDNGKAQV